MAGRFSEFKLFGGTIFADLECQPQVQFYFLNGELTCHSPIILNEAETNTLFICLAKAIKKMNSFSKCSFKRVNHFEKIITIQEEGNTAIRLMCFTKCRQKIVRLEKLYINNRSPLDNSSKFLFSLHENLEEIYDFLINLVSASSS